MVIQTQRILGAIAVATLLVGMACAPAAAPSPTAAPAKPTATTAPAAKPAETAAPATKPADAGKPAASADWKAEWDKTVAAAKKEGTVTVVFSTGELYRQAAMEFRKPYPEITLEYSGMKGSDFGPRVLAERGGGQYLWDVHVGGAQTSIRQLRPNGVLDPVKPALVLPEVLDDSKWLLGLDRVWMDKDKQYVFGFEAGLQVTVFVNRDMVPESELSKHDQLLDPKWKGKIVSGDMRTAGAHNGVAQWLLKLKGEDWLRKFYGQLVIMKDERAEVESLIRGAYPIMVGINPAQFQQFAQEGLTKNIKPLDPDSQIGAALSTGASHALLINKAPHPNAAKVFINWLLSKEGQQAYSGATGLLSRRTDVTGGDQTFKPKAGVAYSDLNAEENMVFSKQATDIATELIR